MSIRLFSTPSNEARFQDLILSEDTILSGEVLCDSFRIESGVVGASGAVGGLLRPVACAPE